jgi:hypothetical protein
MFKVKNPSRSRYWIVRMLQSAVVKMFGRGELFTIDIYHLKVLGNLVYALCNGTT